MIKVEDIFPERNNFSFSYATEFKNEKNELFHLSNILQKELILYNLIIPLVEPLSSPEHVNQISKILTDLTVNNIEEIKAYFSEKTTLSAKVNDTLNLIRLQKN